MGSSAIPGQESRAAPWLVGIETVLMVSPQFCRLPEHGPKRSPRRPKTGRPVSHRVGVSSFARRGGQGQPSRASLCLRFWSFLNASNHFMSPSDSSNSWSVPVFGADRVRPGQGALSVASPKGVGREQFAYRRSEVWG